MSLSSVFPLHTLLDTEILYSFLNAKVYEFQSMEWARDITIINCHHHLNRYFPHRLLTLSLCVGIFEDVTSLSCSVFSDLGNARTSSSVVDRFSVFSDGCSLTVTKLPAYLQWSKLKIYRKQLSFDRDVTSSKIPTQGDKISLKMLTYFQIFRFSYKQLELGFASSRIGIV